MCKGCFQCFAKGREKCPLNDELDEIYEKMKKAEGVILAAPTYAMGVPALMKNFIDRLSYTLHRPCFFDQSFLAVSTVGGVMGLKQTLGQLSLISACSKKSLKLGIAMPPFEVPLIQNSTPRKLKKAVNGFFVSMHDNKRHIPGFGDFAYFAAFKSMSAVSSNKEKCPADFEYYKDKDIYFYPANRRKAVIGKVTASIMRLSMKLVVKDKSTQTGPMKAASR